MIVMTTKSSTSVNAVDLRFLVLYCRRIRYLAVPANCLILRAEGPLFTQPKATPWDNEPYSRPFGPAGPCWGGSLIATPTTFDRPRIVGPSDRSRSRVQRLPNPGRSTLGWINGAPSGQKPCWGDSSTANPMIYFRFLQAYANRPIRPAANNDSVPGSGTKVTVMLKS